VAGVDAFSQGLTERLDRVALVQGSERRSDLEWAFGYPVDGVAARAIGSGKGLAPLLGLAGRQRRRHQKYRNQGLTERELQHGRGLVKLVVHNRRAMFPKIDLRQMRSQ